MDAGKPPWELRRNASKTKSLCALREEEDVAFRLFFGKPRN